jgi:hypothetical protein
MSCRRICERCFFHTNGAVMRANMQSVFISLCKEDRTHKDIVM